MIFNLTKLNGTCPVDNLYINQVPPAGSFFLTLSLSTRCLTLLLSTRYLTLLLSTRYLTLLLLDTYLEMSSSSSSFDDGRLRVVVRRLFQPETRSAHSLLALSTFAPPGDLLSLYSPVFEAVYVSNRRTNLLSIRSEAERDRACDTLVAEGLIRRDNETNVVSMDPGLHDRVFELLGPEEKRRQLKNAAWFLIQKSPRDLLEFQPLDAQALQAHQEKCRISYDHALVVLKRAGQLGASQASEILATIAINAVR